MGLFLVSLLMTHMLLTGTRKEHGEWLSVAHTVGHSAKEQEDRENCGLFCSSSAAGKKMKLKIVAVSVAPICSPWGSFYLYLHLDIL